MAFFLAIVLWFIATEGNEERPALEIRHVTAPIQWMNVEDEFIVTSAPITVDVIVEGPRFTLPFSNKEVHVIVDMNGLGPGTHVVSVHPEPPAGMTVRSVYPEQIPVVLERRHEQTLNVTVTIDQQEGASEVRIVDVHPEKVRILGALSVVNQVDQIVARIDRLDALKQRVFLVPMDASGLKVQGVELTVDAVDVTMEVRTEDDFTTEQTNGI